MIFDKSIVPVDYSGQILAIERKIDELFGKFVFSFCFLLLFLFSFLECVFFFLFVFVLGGE